MKLLKNLSKTAFKYTLPLALALFPINNNANAESIKEKSLLENKIEENGCLSIVEDKEGDTEYVRMAKKAHREGRIFTGLDYDKAIGKSRAAEPQGFPDYFAKVSGRKTFGSGFAYKNYLITAATSQIKILSDKQV